MTNLKEQEEMFMSKEEPYREKIEHARKRIENNINEDQPFSSGLPSRREIHQKRRKTKKRELGFPLLRVLVIAFILLPAIIFSLYTYRDHFLPTKVKQVVEENDGYETISIDQPNQKDSVSKQTRNEQEKDKKAKQSTNESVPDVVVPSGQSEAKTEEAAPEKKNNLDLPQQPVANDAAQAADSQSANKAAITTHTVQPGETLYRIAMKYYQSKDGIEIIREANGLPNNNIHVGQVLKIPNK
jgi:LysM repeat protein